MTWIKVVIFVGLCSFALAKDLKCGKNAFFSTCGNPCPPTCHDPKPDKCNAKCVAGCFCKKGYYLDGDGGKCVKYRDCSSSEDSDSDDCDKSDKSDKHHDKSDKSDKHHDKSDKSDKSCKYSSESHEKCGPNEKYGKCKHSCPATCKSSKPKSCKNKCKKRGCICKDGFVKDKYDNCIPKGLCPHKYKNCDKNEKYSNETIPPPTCQSPSCLDSLPKYCPLYTTHGGCVCKSGFLRDKKGRCVSPDDCNKYNHSKDKSHHSKDRSSKDSTDEDSTDEDSTDEDSTDESKDCDCKKDKTCECKKTRCDCKDKTCELDDCYDYLGKRHHGYQ